jgi:hypothetical protein
MTGHILMQLQEARPRKNTEVEESKLTIDGIEIDMFESQRINETVAKDIKLDPAKWEYVTF